MMRYAEYKESGIEWIGIIPVSWDVSKSKYHYISNDGGVWGNEPENDGTDVIVLRSTEQTVDGKWIIEDPAIRSLKGQKYQKQLLKENDLVMTKSSGSNLHIGKTSIVTAEIESMQCCYSNFMQRIRISAKDNPKFFWYFLNSTLAREQFVFLQNSTSGLGNINSENINSLWVPHICKEQQDRIVLYLDQRVTKIDRLISEKESLISLLLEKRTSTICIAVTKGIDPAVKMKKSGFEWLGETPSHWEVVPAKALFSQSKETRREGDVQLTASQKYGIISQEDYMALQNSKIVLADKGLENWKHVEPNDFIISLRSFQGGLEISYIPGCITWHYIVLKPSAAVDPEYFKWLFKSPRYIQALQRTANFIRDGQDLRFSNFVQVPLPLIPMDEQREIAEYLNRETARIDSIIADVTEQIEKLKEYRQSIISEVVTGKVAVE